MENNFLIGKQKQTNVIVKKNGPTYDTKTALDSKGCERSGKANPFSEYSFAVKWMANGDNGVFESCYGPTIIIYII